MTVSEELCEKPEWGEGDIVYVSLSVEDTGVGMTPKELRNLFARFSQASPKTHTRYGGSGLGLFISKSLVEMQGAEIGVVSKSGTGSSFSFFIKTRKTVQPTTLDKEQRVFPAENTDCGPQFSVLVVEDNIVNQFFLAKQLMKLGFEVQVANHGEEALIWLKNTKRWHANNGIGLDIGVILMDIEVPVMDGLTATRAIRALEQNGDFTTHIPIIAVSANARSEQVAKAFDAGVDDSIAKPFRIPELLPKIAHLTRR